VEATARDRSPLGVFNLCGNVSEFLRDQEPYQGQQCAVYKGSSYGGTGWMYGMANFTQHCTLDYAGDHLGFRCVKKIPK
jgi:formylglycine-generating enzyme required for sulfatase activity